MWPVSDSGHSGRSIFTFWTAASASAESSSSSVPVLKTRMFSQFSQRGRVGSTLAALVLHRPTPSGIKSGFVWSNCSLFCLFTVQRCTRCRDHLDQQWPLTGHTGPDRFKPVHDKLNRILTYSRWSKTVWTISWGHFTPVHFNDWTGPNWIKPVRTQRLSWSWFFWS